MLEGVLPWVGRTRWKFPTADTGHIDPFYGWEGPIDVDQAIESAEPYLQGHRTCIQAGGCIGVWPTRLAQIFNTVHTFESQADNYQCLTHNTEGITNIITYPNALGSKDGLVKMVQEPRYVGHSGAWMVEDGGDIPQITIDSLNLSHVDLIWLDIEGSEYNALEGARQTIERCKPVIGIEYRGFCARYAGDPIKLLKGLDYRERDCTVKNDRMLVHEVTTP